MDPNIYSAILESRGEDSQSPSRFDANLTNAHYQMLEDIYRDKVLWTGNKCTDWHLFIGLHHPFYSIFKVPIGHEFTQKERIVVLLCMIAISSVIASASTFSKVINDDQWIGTGISLLGGIFITVSSKIMQFMAMCNCKCLRQNHPKIKQCLENIGHFVISIWIIISIIAFFGGILQAYYFSFLHQWFVAFCIANFFPYLMKLLGNTLAFTKKYKRDWKYHQNDNSPYLVSFQQYQDLLNVDKPKFNQTYQKVQI